MWRSAELGDLRARGPALPGPLLQRVARWLQPRPGTFAWTSPGGYATRAGPDPLQ
jgi:hypothetical protein